MKKINRQFCLMAASLLAGWLISLLALFLWWWLDSGELSPAAIERYEGVTLKVAHASVDWGQWSVKLSRLGRDTARPLYLTETGWATVTTGAVYLDAARFQFIRCQCRRSSGELQFELFWSLADDMRQVAGVWVPSGWAGSYGFAGSNVAWTGRIMEFGLIITGPRDGEVEILAIEALGDSAVTRLRWHLANWFAFEPWSHSSINSVNLGGRASSVSFTSLAAVSTGVSLLLYLVLMARRERRSRTGGALAILMLSWLLLDMRWFTHLSEQAAVTRDAFAGRAMEERLMRQDHGLIEEFARQVRELIEDEQSRVFLITDQPELRFLHERLTFHLLPLNVIDFKRRFRQLGQTARPGDHVIVTGETPVEYRVNDGPSLFWKGRGSICAQAVHESRFASLYRVCGNSDQ